MIQVLPFLLGEMLYGLELIHLQEVVDEAPIYYLPGAPQGIIGAINLHGRILPVLDLPLQFGCKPGPRSKRLIVPADQGCSLALAVDSVRPILQVDPRTIKPCQPVRQKDCVKNVIEGDGEHLRLLDLKLLREQMGQLLEFAGG